MNTLQNHDDRCALLHNQSYCDCAEGRINAVADRNIYGTRESEGLVNPQAYHAAERDITVDWTDKRLGRITRLRLLSDPGFPVCDVSYVHGVLKDGTPCRVQVPFSQLPKRGMSKAIVEAAKRDGVFAKGLGILDCVSLLN